MTCLEAMARNVRIRRNKGVGNGGLFERCIERQATRTAPFLGGMADVDLPRIEAVDVPNELPTDLAVRQEWTTGLRII